jgi:hypothetical protein
LIEPSDAFVLDNATEKAHGSQAPFDSTGTTCSVAILVDLETYLNDVQGQEQGRTDDSSTETCYQRSERRSRYGSRLGLLATCIHRIQETGAVRLIRREGGTLYLVGSISFFACSSNVTRSFVFF